MEFCTPDLFLGSRFRQVKEIRESGKILSKIELSMKMPIFLQKIYMI
jgi:hypothetical protein